MKRRDLLKAFASCGILAGVSLQGLQSAVAATGKTLVVIFQRGGCDGLNCIVPYGEDAYYRLRPRIGVLPPGQLNGALNLDGFFGMHPAMAPLHALYQQGQVAVFPAVHYDNASQSHFDSQQYIESGAISRNTDGWLNRHLQSFPQSGDLRAISFNAELAQSLRGSILVPSATDLADMNLGVASTREATMLERLTRIYQQAPRGNSYLRAQFSAGQTGIATLNLVKSLDVQHYVPDNGVVYPTTGYGTQLRQVAQLIKSGVGLEIATIDSGAWDTHANQGNGDPAGVQSGRLREFSAGIAALHADLGSYRNDVLILTMTEFGRTAQENASGGTDHGNASAWYAIGPMVNGGIHGQWPGLSAASLLRGRYLAHSIDFRDIFASLVAQHLGNTNVAAVVPGHVVTPLGFLA